LQSWDFSPGSCRAYLLLVYFSGLTTILIIRSKEKMFLIFLAFTTHGLFFTNPTDFAKNIFSQLCAVGK